MSTERRKPAAAPCLCNALRQVSRAVKRSAGKNLIASKEKAMSDSHPKGTALITGASTGIGAIYADRLAKRGYDLILVARNQARLQALAARLAEETGRWVTPLRADLNDKADLAKVERMLRADEAITLLVNNAVLGAVTPLLETDVAKVDDMIALNVTALTRLTYAAAPAFVARGRGTIINIAPIVGISPETLNGVYGATKAYVLALSHSLQHELADKGIRVQAVLPAGTATDFWDKTGLPYQNLPEGTVMSAEDMVDAALVGLDQGELVTLPSLQDGDAWARFEAARRAISKQFFNSTPALRYRVGVRASG
jgi:short-subunit dehydrogenase